MSETRLPEYVIEFVALLSDYLKNANAEMIVDEESLDGVQPSLTYVLKGTPYDAVLTIHQTQQSLDKEIPEFRARLGATLPDQVSESLRGMEGTANTFASLGALVRSNKTLDIVTQSLLTEKNAGLTAYLMSVAASFNCISILESVRLTINGEKEKVKIVSEWTDLDFEKIQAESIRREIDPFQEHITWRHTGNIFDSTGTD